MAPNPTDDTIAQLERDWPDWQIWTVRRVVGGTTWCARLHADHKTIINADSPEHLAEYIAEASRRAGTSSAASPGTAPSRPSCPRAAGRACPR